MATFAEITDELTQIIELANDEGQDINDETKIKLDEYIVALRDYAAEKVDNFSALIKRCKAVEEGYKAEAQRLQKKAQSMKRKIDYLKTMYLGIMQEQGINKVNGSFHSILIGKSSSVRVDVDPKTLPANFVKHKEEWVPDKTAIKAAIKDGQTIGGCSIVENNYLKVM